MLNLIGLLEKTNSAPINLYVTTVYIEWSTANLLVHCYALYDNGATIILLDYGIKMVCTAMPFIKTVHL